MTVQDLITLLEQSEDKTKRVLLAVWFRDMWIHVPIEDVTEDRHRDCIVIQAEK